MNELDRYAVSLENMEVLRDQVEEQTRELAALKARPIGVVVSELRAVVTDALMGMIAAVTSSTPPANEPPPPFIQSAIDRAVDRIARLNSSPASAGDERATLSAFTAWGESIGLRPALQTVGELKAFKAGAEWKASVALSANYSDQVRQMVPGDDELYDLASSACQMALAHGVGEESFMVLARTVRDRCAMLAAAPSAVSQEQG